MAGGSMNTALCCSLSSSSHAVLIVVLLLLRGQVGYTNECRQIMINLESISSEAIVKSLHYPDFYLPNLDCSYNIVAPEGRRVRLYFTSFTLESSNAYNTCIFDFITIHDGDSDADTSFGSFCGDTMPPVIVTGGRNLYIHFVSDGSVEEVGFRAVVQTVSSDYQEPIPTSSTDTCTTILVEDTGEFFSPGYPESYDHNQDCYYIIVLPDRDETIKLRFTSFDLELSQSCIYDYIEVRDGSSRASPLIGRYCGGFDNEPPNIMMSTGPTMYVQFHTDISASFQGFYAEYVTSSIGFQSSTGISDDAVTSVCDIRHAILTKRSGFIVSHVNYPQGTYDHHSHCSVQILGTRSYEKVYIDFLEVDLPSSSSCGSSSSDYIRVTDGQLNSDQTAIATLCGNDVGRYTTSQQYSSIVFRTDGAANEGYMGFKALYTIFYEDAYGCEENDFHCDNDHCVSSSSVCDGYNHCGDNSDEDKGCGEEATDLSWLMILGIIAGCILLIGVGVFMACCCLNNTSRRPQARNPTMNGTVLSVISPQDSGLQNPAFNSVPMAATAPTVYTNQAAALPPKYSDIWADPVDVPLPQGATSNYSLPPAPESSTLYTQGGLAYSTSGQSENEPKHLDILILPPPAEVAVEGIEDRDRGPGVE